jgi:hypothetical protein
MYIQNQLQKCKWNNYNRLTVKIFLLSILSIFCTSSYSQIPNPLEIKPKNLKLFSEFYDSYDKAKDATEVLIGITNIVKKIEADEQTISQADASWNELANSYKAAADKIQQASLLTDFDKTPFRITAEEMANCDNKPTNIGKLKAYRDALALALIDGKTEMEKIKAYKEHLESSKTALAYLKNVYATLITNLYLLIYLNGIGWH